MIRRMAISALVVSGGLFVATSVYEGYSDEPYLDSVGVLTIGLGRTEGVKPGEKTTVERELVLMLKDMEGRKAAIARCVTAPLYQYELDAYMSLVYNVGNYAFCSSSIPEKLKAGDYAAACKTILDFNKVPDCSKPRVWSEKKKKFVCPLVPLAGLTKRRQAEYETCIGKNLPAAGTATADAVKPGGEG